MLNQVVLVGKVAEVPVLSQNHLGKSFTDLLLNVDRGWKNSDGELECDLIKITLWNGVAQSAVDVCHVGAVVGIEGRIQAAIIMSKENKPHYCCEIIAEKISYLQSE